MGRRLHQGRGPAGRAGAGAGQCGDPGGDLERGAIYRIAGERIPRVLLRRGHLSPQLRALHLHSEPAGKRGGDQHHLHAGGRGERGTTTHRPAALTRDRPGKGRPGARRRRRPRLLLPCRVHQRCGNRGRAPHVLQLQRHLGRGTRHHWDE